MTANPVQLRRQEGYAYDRIGASGKRAPVPVSSTEEDDLAVVSARRDVVEPQGTCKRSGRDYQLCEPTSVFTGIPDVDS